MRYNFLLAQVGSRICKLTNWLNCRIIKLSICSLAQGYCVQLIKLSVINDGIYQMQVIQCFLKCEQKLNITLKSIKLLLRIIIKESAMNKLYVEDLNLCDDIMTLGHLPIFLEVFFFFFQGFRNFPTYQVMINSAWQVAQKQPSS